MKPRPYLTKEGEAIFSEIVKWLESRGQVEAVDEAFVSQTANACYLAEKYAHIVNEEGAVQEFATGAQNVSGAYSIMHKERAAYASMCKALGVTPEAREKIAAFASKKAAKSAAMNLLKLAK